MIGGSSIACVCWGVRLAVVILTKVLHLPSFIKNFVFALMLKSVIIIYDLSPFSSFYMCTIYRGSRKLVFSVSIRVTSWFFSGKYQICIQHYPSGVSNPLPLMDNSAVYHVYSMEK